MGRRERPDRHMTQTQSEICRILLVDDHKLLMEGVRSLLAPYAHLRVVGMALTGGEAVALAASMLPHLMVLDLGMPGMNGVETGRAVLEVRPGTRILVYTGHEDQRWLPELIDIGIMRHVRKSEPPGVLLRAIESVRQGNIFLSFSDPGGRLAALLRARRQAADETGGEGGSNLNALSPREKEIFRLLADGWSVKAIAGDLHISPKTVETHKYNLLTKLQAGSVGDLVKIAIRHGLLKV